MNRLPRDRGQFIPLPSVEEALGYPYSKTDRVSIAQFILLDVKRVISASAIDAEALASGNGDSPPKGAAPKL